ncbi:MAG: formate dehydrogenase subunit alpha [Proteobacteria bacterium]|nr:MAG: formate dehydrogenase subunit alpha [Pseudomonadota bacterium]
MSTITFTLDDVTIEALPGETILQAAQRTGTDIPHLCYQEGYRPDGNCRACVVEIKDERALAPSCCRVPSEGMEVASTSERARHSQRMVIELLKSDMPDAGTSPYTPASELDHWAEFLGVNDSRFTARQQPPKDLSNPAIAVNLDACIQCTRCVRACREEQVNDVIGFAYSGSQSAIVFDLDDPMGLSSCVSCGECVQACPTGALMPAQGAANTVAERVVESACPYCGVGCLLNFHVTDDRIQFVEGRDGPSNHGRLCVKGRYGFDYVHHAERLTKPLIRREGVAKTAEVLSQADIARTFREASWTEALDFAASGFTRIRDEHGSHALAGFGSAKGSNEEAYLFQKLVRVGFGTNNVDHCTRLCHASSVAAMLETIGSGSVSNQVADVAVADVILIIGAKPTSNHPVAATFMKNAVKDGKTLILLDPYRSDLARHAKHYLQFRADTDVPLLNAMMHTIIDQGLHNVEYIERYTEGFDALRECVKEYSPEKVAPICGVTAATIREVAEVYATSKSSMIFWGMGISQHIHGTDNARCLISLALLTGQIGRPGTGLHPLRGQNNVQGASDVGLIPMVFPDYQPVSDDHARARFEALWDTQLDPIPGLTVVEIMDAVHAGNLHGMYIMGENPAMSDPNLNHARAALAKLEHLVIQDIFFTETAGFADVILPASAFPEKTGTFTNTDRRVQLGRQAIPCPGDARQDLWIIQQLGRRLGIDWHYDDVAEVFDEMRHAMPSISGITWERLQKEHSVTYPCTDEGDPGDPILFLDGFPTASGRGKFVPATYTHAAELPDDEYEFILMTGRQLEHWHTGSMTRHTRVLDALEPEAVVSLHPLDLQERNIPIEGFVKLQSRRGEIVARIRPDTGLQRGTVSMPFCYAEAAANLLTVEDLDPHGKIPEFKFCAIKIAVAVGMTA